MALSLENITLLSLLDGKDHMALDYWGDDIDRAQEALDDWTVSASDLDGVPVGEVHIWTAADPSRMDSYLLIKHDDGLITGP